MEKFVSGTIKQAECGNPCSELGKELARCLKRNEIVRIDTSPSGYQSVSVQHMFGFDLEL